MEIPEDIKLKQECYFQLRKMQSVSWLFVSFVPLNSLLFISKRPWSFSASFIIECKIVILFHCWL